MIRFGLQLLLQYLFQLLDNYISLLYFKRMNKRYIPCQFKIVNRKKKNL